MGFKLLVFGFVSSLLLVFVGSLGVLFGTTFIHSFVSSNLKLVPNSDLYKQWLNPPVPVYLSFYLFNLKNGQEFEKHGAKPVFEEIGPFVYQEFITKEEIVDNFNFTITYKERRRYSFVPELSPYEDTYPITTINMAPIVVINGIKYSSGVVHNLINVALQATGETLLVTQQAKNLLFGYKDNFLAFLKTLDKKLVPTEYVGLFYGKNDTIDGLYTIYTGADDYNRTGVIERFNYMNKLNFWSSDYANMINGTDGTLIQPFVEKSRILYIFESDLCRSLYLIYNGTYYINDDIEVYNFGPDEYFFANSSVNPDNGGFCLPKGNCLPAGILNLTSCTGGIPIIMSSPHFLFADEQFVKDVIGLKPNLTAHTTELFIEPLTGVPMKAHKRIQFNTKLFKDPRINISKNLPEILYPLFWVDENFELDKVNAKKFFDEVEVPILAITIGKYVILGTGCLFLLICLSITVVKWRKSRNSSQTSNRFNETVNWTSNETTPLLDG